MDVGGLIHIVLVLIVVGIIAGLLWWLVGRAPFLPEPFSLCNSTDYPRVLRDFLDLRDFASAGRPVIAGPCGIDELDGTPQYLPANGHPWNDECEWRTALFDA